MQQQNNQEPIQQQQQLQKKRQCVGASKRKKPKLEDGRTIDDMLEGWTQCCYLMPKKRKFCNLSRTPGSKFCGLHRPASEEQPVAMKSKKALKREAAALRKQQETAVSAQTEETSDVRFHLNERIPCPIDPQHSIFRRNLESHVKKCTAQRNASIMNRLPYYSKDCNSGPPLCSPCTATSWSDLQLQALVVKVESCYKRLLDRSATQPALFNHIARAVSVDDATSACSDNSCHRIDADLLPIAVQTAVAEKLGGDQSSPHKRRYGKQ